MGVIKPAKKTSADLEQIVTGIHDRNGDLTKRIRVSSKDEIGMLSNGINDFISLLQMIIKNIKIQAEHMAESIEVMKNDIETSNSSMEGISSVMEQLSAGAQQINASIERLSQNNQKILENASDIVCRNSMTGMCFSI